MADRKPLLHRALFARGSWSETSRISTILRKETVGGALLLLAAAIALIWANSPWSAAYDRLGDLHVGTDRLGLHLDLSLGGWAADGLLAIFFFVVGLELKREFVAGDLRDPGRAALPIAAAVGGMVVPAAIFVAFTAPRGWRRQPRLGHPDGHRHRVRGRRAGRHLHPPAGGPADVPAHPGRRRRPARDHGDRGVLHRQDQRRRAPGRADPADAVRGPRAAPDPVVVAARPAGGAHLGIRPRVRGARDGRGGAARLHRAGAAQRGGRRSGGRARPGRALRAPDAAAVGGLRGAGVRVLRRRCDVRRLSRFDHSSERSDCDRHRRRRWSSARRSGCSAPPGHWPR